MNDEFKWREEKKRKIEKQQEKGNMNNFETNSTK